MTSPFSYSSNPADGGIIYLDGLTAEKEQRILIVSFNDLLISPEDIEILEKRPSVSEEEIESINSKNLPEAEKKKILDELKKKTTEEKKAQKREAKKIAYDIAAQFNTRAAMNGRCKNKFMSVVLSFPDSEREMLEKNPQMMEDIVQDWLDGMGFENAQHFAVYHYDSAQPHIHIYVGMVGPKLKVYNSFQTKYRSQQVNRDIENKYGLKPGIGIDKNYEADLEKTSPKNKARMEIFKILKGCIDTYIPSAQKLESFLKSKGITMKEIKHNNGKMGYVFEKDGVPFAGGEIGRMFTYGNLTKQFEDNARKLEVFSGLVNAAGIEVNKYIRIPRSEQPTEENKTRAQHRRTYKPFGTEAFAITKDGDKYALFNNGKDIFISDIPFVSNEQIKKANWISVDGRKLSYNEMMNDRIKHVTAGKTEKTAAGKTATVSRSSTSSPAPTFVPAGKTVRDNKSVANTGDGLDETEEYIDEDGNKKTRKKRKLSI